VQSERHTRTEAAYKHIRRDDAAGDALVAQPFANLAHTAQWDLRMRFDVRERRTEGEEEGERAAE